MTETWKPVPDYSGFYEVSDHGRIRSIDRHVKHPTGSLRRTKGRILKPALSSGYLSVTLSKEGKTKSFLLHRIVLETFIGPCPDGCETCHNDGDRSNNRTDNLRWDTPKKNHADKIKHGTTSKGTKNPRATLDDDAIIIIRTMKGVISNKKLALIFGIEDSYVSMIQHNKAWTHVK